MKAFRAITVSNNKAQLRVLVGDTIEEVESQATDFGELIEVKDITQKLKLDTLEVMEALRLYRVNELSQLLILALMEEYENLI